MSLKNNTQFLFIISVVAIVAVVCIAVLFMNQAKYGVVKQQDIAGSATADPDCHESCFVDGQIGCLDAADAESYLTCLKSANARCTYFCE